MCIKIERNEQRYVSDYLAYNNQTARNTMEIKVLYY